MMYYKRGRVLHLGVGLSDLQCFTGHQEYRRSSNQIAGSLFRFILAVCRAPSVLFIHWWNAFITSQWCLEKKINHTIKTNLKAIEGTWSSSEETSLLSTSSRSGPSSAVSMTSSERQILQTHHSFRHTTHMRKGIVYNISSTNSFFSNESAL